jgi:hypothetical protein
MSMGKTTRAKAPKRQRAKLAQPKLGDLGEQLVLVVRAPQCGFTIEQWEKFIEKCGMQLDEIMTTEAWNRRLECAAIGVRAKMAGA